MTTHYHKTSFGWIFSLFLHGIVAAILYHSYFTPHQPKVQYIEIGLGSISGGIGSIPALSLPINDDKNFSDGTATSGENNPVQLPERNSFSFNDEVIHLPTSKKNVNPDPSAPLAISKNPTAVGEEKQPTSLGGSLDGKKESAIGPYMSEGNGSGVLPGRGGDGMGGFGTGEGIGDNVSFAVQWTNGKSRKLASGDVPTFPSGVNVAAQIKLRVVVSPQGMVKSATPMQKGETQLENAAINKVRLWKFEPLLSAQPQVEQICNITFNFRLK